MECDTHSGQILGQDGTYEALVAEQGTANALQGQVEDGIAFIHTGRGQGDARNDAFRRREQQGVEAEVLLVFGGTESPIRFPAEDRVATHPFWVAHGDREPVYQMHGSLERTQRPGPVLMQEGFDLPKVGQLPDEGRTVAQVGKPGGPVSAPVLPDSLVTVIPEKRADKLHRQRLRIG